MTPDDTARQAADVPAPSLAEIAAAGLACLVPPGAAEEPQFAWLAASVAPAGGAAALQRLLAAPAGGDLPLLSIAYHLQLTPAELLTCALARDVELDPLWPHALASLQGFGAQRTGPRRPTLGLLARWLGGSASLLLTGGR